MNCVELQNSLAEIEDGSSQEQQVHLRSCAACAALLAELSLIASSAPKLREVDEPSPRVWNAIAIALRQEGLVHPPHQNRRPISSFSLRWGRAGWLVPLAAALLIAVGIYVRPHAATPEQVVVQNTVQRPGPAVIAGLNDEEFLQEAAANTPGMKAQWEDNLRNANDYIRDAQTTVDENPNDPDARRTLLDAYQQKAMLFELAMDRSLP